VLNRERGIEISYSDYQIANQMIADYQVLITGENVTQEVIRKLELPMTKETLEKMIHLESPKDTRFLEISITSEDPVKAMTIANTVREIACVEIERIMDVEAVNLVYEAELPQRPSGPPMLKITVISGILSFFLMMMYYSLRYIMDDSIRTEEDVEAHLGLHVLAVIPNSDKLSRQKNTAPGTAWRRKQ
jgi:capsular polysaccharide biosynthesis protein